jgi:hypothetical protein
MVVDSVNQDDHKRCIREINNATTLKMHQVPGKKSTISLDDTYTFDYVAGE